MPSLALPTETVAHHNSVRRDWLPCRRAPGQDGGGCCLAKARSRRLKATTCPPGKPQERSNHALWTLLTGLLVPTATEP